MNLKYYYDHLTFLCKLDMISRCSWETHIKRETGCLEQVTEDVSKPRHLKSLERGMVFGNLSHGTKRNGLHSLSDQEQLSMLGQNALWQDWYTTKAGPQSIN